MNTQKNLILTMPATNILEDTIQKKKKTSLNSIMLTNTNFKSHKISTEVYNTHFGFLDKFSMNQIFNMLLKENSRHDIDEML